MGLTCNESVPIRDRKDTKRHAGGRPCDDRSRHWSDANWTSSFQNYKRISFLLFYLVCDNMLCWSWEIIQYLSGFIVRIK